MEKQQQNRWREKLIPYLLILFISCLIVSPQVIAHSTMLGSDSIFHYNRFYEAAKQIQNWNFSFFQSNYGFQQSGRIVNAVYGPIFAYLNGALLGLVRTWYRYQILTSVLIYWIAGSGMYQLARKVAAPRLVAMLLTIIYMNIGWLPRWETAQNMNAWGAALAPYLCICGVRMIENHSQPVKKWQLILMMTTIIQIHVLSSIFFAVTLVPFFIIGLIQARDRRQMWHETLLAVTGTLILTANVWGALLEIETKNRIAKPAPFELTKNVLIPSWGSTFRDYLLVGVMVLLIVQIIYVIRYWHESAVNNTVTMVGLAFLLLSTNLVPWAAMEQAVPGLRRFLQFPDRLTIIAYPLLFTGIALTSTRIQRHITKVYWQRLLVCCLAGVTAWSLISNMVNVHHDSYYYHTAKVLIKQNGVSKHSPYGQMIRLSVHTVYPGQLLQLVEKRNPDYLPITKRHLSRQYVRSYVYAHQIIGHANQFDHSFLSGGRLCLTWQSNKSGTIRLPIVTYNESRLIVNGHELNHYRKSSIGAPYVSQHQGTNRAVLEFVTPGWLKVLMTISLCGILISLLLGGYHWGTAKLNRDKINA